MIGRAFHCARAAAAALFVFLAAGCAHAPPPQGIVAAAHPLAADAGYAVLERGGSAVDAAIAVQAMLGLVEPQSSGIGGGAFLLHWSQAEGRLTSYDGRETAPAAARPELFLDSEGKPLGYVEAVVGGRSVGVPGVLRMLELAHRRHGKLPWRELFVHAIAAAEEGFALSPRLHAQLAAEKFFRSPLFYDAAGKPKPVGSRIVNADYATTLRRIAAEGAGAFYHGAIARDIVRAVRSHANPGKLTEADLAAYRAIEREPLCAPYRAWEVCSMGPPSSGGLGVLQILGILERTHFARAPPHAVEAVHLFAEAGRLAYADRALYVGDPAFVHVPVERLLSPAYLEERASRIGERSMGTARPGKVAGRDTSHFAIADAAGNVVSMTTSIESRFGSRIMVRGFLLNNQLTDFDFVPGSANQVEGSKRPRSSMAPTIVRERSGEVRLAVGSPGGPNIINYVARALVAVLDWDFDLPRAFAAPNFGSRNGPTLLERGTSYEALQAPLERRGHRVEIDSLESGLHGIERTATGWRGGADPRREGVVRGD